MTLIKKRGTMIKKRGTSVFHTTIKDIQFKNVQRILKCGLETIRTTASGLLCVPEFLRTHSERIPV